MKDHRYTLASVFSELTVKEKRMKVSKGMFQRAKTLQDKSKNNKRFVKKQRT